MARLCRWTMDASLAVGACRPMVSRVGAVVASVHVSVLSHLRQRRASSSAAAAELTDAATTANGSF